MKNGVKNGEEKNGENWGEEKMNWKGGRGRLKASFNAAVRDAFNAQPFDIRVVCR